MADAPEGLGITEEIEQAAASLLVGDVEAPSKTADAAPAAKTPAEPANQAPEPEAQEVQVESDAENAQQDGEPPALVKVKAADGTETEVPLNEVLAVYGRQRELSEREQALVAQRAEFDQLAQTERGQYLQILQFAQQALQSQMPQEPDWNRLYHEDPVEFARQHAAWQMHRERIGALQAQQRQLQEQQQAEQVEGMRQHIAREREQLAQRIPEWKNPETAKAERGRLIEFGRKHGYGDEELGAVYDSRAVAIMRKAMLYDELMAKKPGIAAQAPPPKLLQPGNANGGGRGPSVKQARERFARTGAIEDAASLLVLES